MGKKKKPKNLAPNPTVYAVDATAEGTAVVAAQVIGSKVTWTALGPDGKPTGQPIETMGGISITGSWFDEASDVSYSDGLLTSQQFKAQMLGQWTDTEPPVPWEAATPKSQPPAWPTPANGVLRTVRALPTLPIETTSEWAVWFNGQNYGNFADEGEANAIYHAIRGTHPGSCYCNRCVQREVTYAHESDLRRYVEAMCTSMIGWTGSLNPLALETRLRDAGLRGVLVYAHMGRVSVTGQRPGKDPLFHVKFNMIAPPQDYADKVNDLARHIPGMQGVVICPAGCRRDTPYGGSDAWGGSVMDLVIHLNDKHRWTRERIADHLEALEKTGLDLTVHTEPVEAPVRDMVAEAAQGAVILGKTAKAIEADLKAMLAELDTKHPCVVAEIPPPGGETKEET